VEAVVKRYTKHPVGAHYGLREWLLQRVTAVIMGIYTIVLLVCLVMRPPASYTDFRAMFADGFFRVATMFFFAALLYHAWVGLRDILMDYVKPVWIRLGLQVVVATVLLSYLIWSASILWGLPPSAVIGGGAVK
jgi:succinate dehydrogenase / fumarate reductase, membrane anchor subunit